jgi:hypothetical protein
LAEGGELDRAVAQQQRQGATSPLLRALLTVRLRLINRSVNALYYIIQAAHHFPVSVLRQPTQNVHVMLTLRTRQFYHDRNQQSDDSPIACIDLFTDQRGFDMVGVTGSIPVPPTISVQAPAALPMWVRLQPRPSEICISYSLVPASVASSVRPIVGPSISA